MVTKMDIVIWDTIPNRISLVEKNIALAKQRLNIRGEISIMSEPPMVARMNLMHRIPTLEIDGLFWTLNPGEDISEEDCHYLLSLLKDRSK